MKKMRILISNDDGIGAPGLAALAAAVEDLGEVFVVAPDSPQSAAGHSITLRRPLRIQYVRLPGEPSLEGVAVDGRPADCVRLAIRNLLPQRPDLVLSGVNAGANVGINVFYSGTVAAAAEAAMCGIPGVAFSAALAGTDENEANFVAAAVYCRDVLDNLLAAGLSGKDLVNVNVPVLSQGPPRGVRVCEQSDADVIDVYTRRHTPEGIEQYVLADAYEFTDPHRESDVAVLRERFITITPLRVNVTNHERFKELKTLERQRAKLGEG
jgi:5'-nucleotidase